MDRITSHLTSLSCSYRFCLRDVTTMVIERLDVSVNHYHVHNNYISETSLTCSYSLRLRDVTIMHVHIVYISVTTLSCSYKVSSPSQWHHVHIVYISVTSLSCSNRLYFSDVPIIFISSYHSDVTIKFTSSLSHLRHYHAHIVSITVTLL